MEIDAKVLGHGWQMGDIVIIGDRQYYIYDYDPIKKSVELIELAEDEYVKGEFVNLSLI